MALPLPSPPLSLLPPRIISIAASAPLPRLPYVWRSGPPCPSACDSGDIDISAPPCDVATGTCPARVPCVAIPVEGHSSCCLPSGPALSLIAAAPAARPPPLLPRSARRRLRFESLQCSQPRQRQSGVVPGADCCWVRHLPGRHLPAAGLLVRRGGLLASWHAGWAAGVAGVAVMPSCPRFPVPPPPTPPPSTHRTHAGT